MEQSTCGALYRALQESLFCPDGSIQPAVHTWLCTAPLFLPALGAMMFMAGQAEKVYNGACEAFMIRPGLDWLCWTKEAMQRICGHYHLEVVVDIQHGELWGCINDETVEDVRTFVLRGQTNSPSWHANRARLCGIPFDRIDVHYHERPSHGIRCERGEIS